MPGGGRPKSIVVAVSSRELVATPASSWLLLLLLAAHKLSIQQACSMLSYLLQRRNVERMRMKGSAKDIFVKLWGHKMCFV